MHNKPITGSKKAMTIWKKIAIGLSALIVCAVGAFLFFAYALSSVFGDMCGNAMIAEYPSPNRKLKAVVFERNCGATTGFSTQVSILQSTDLLENDGGNVFVADTDHGRAPSGAGGGPEIKFRWLSDSSAELQHHPLARVHRAQTKTKGVQVAFVALSDR